MLTYKPNVTIVNESYPSECIIFRFVVHADQAHYQVEGYKEAMAVKGSVPSTTPSSVVSLPLKPAKGEFVKPQQTPSRTEDSIETQPVVEPRGTAPGGLSTDEEDTAVRILPREGPKDVLDEAIAETKAVEHLVGCQTH